MNRSCAREAFDLLRYERFLKQACILAVLDCISPQYHNSQWETTSALTRCTVANSLCHAPVNTIDCRILRCTRATEHIAAKSRQEKTTGHHIAYEELGQSEGRQSTRCSTGTLMPASIPLCCNVDMSSQTLREVSRDRMNQTRVGLVGQTLFTGHGGSGQRSQCRSG